MTSGILADRIGKTKIVALGLLLVALPMGLIVVFQDIWARTATLLLVGIGGGIIESQSSALLILRIFRHSPRTSGQP